MPVHEGVMPLPLWLLVEQVCPSGLFEAPDAARPRPIESEDGLLCVPGVHVSHHALPQTRHFSSAPAWMSWRPFPC